MIFEVQRLAERFRDARANAEPISKKIDDLRKRMKAPKSGSAKALDQQQSERNSADAEVQKAASELAVAKTAAEMKAAEYARLYMQIQRYTLQSERMSQCTAEVNERLAQLTEKATELRRRQKAEDLKAEQLTSETLMADLADFARQKPDRVPLEMAAAVAEFKAAAQLDDLDRIRELRNALEKKLDDIADFRDFRTGKEEQRRREAQAELDKLSAEARERSEFLEGYIRENITSESAQGLLKLNASLTESLISPRSDHLKEVLETPKVSSSELVLMSVSGTSTKKECHRAAAFTRLIKIASLQRELQTKYCCWSTIRGAPR